MKKILKIVVSGMLLGIGGYTVAAESGLPERSSTQPNPFTVSMDCLRSDSDELDEILAKIQDLSLNNQLNRVGNLFNRAKRLLEAIEGNKVAPEQLVTHYTLSIRVLENPETRATPVAQPVITAGTPSPSVLTELPVRREKIPGKGEFAIITTWLEENKARLILPGQECTVSNVLIPRLFDLLASENTMPLEALMKLKNALGRVKMLKGDAECTSAAIANLKEKLAEQETISEAGPAPVTLEKRRLSPTQIRKKDDAFLKYTKTLQYLLSIRSFELAQKHYKSMCAIFSDDCYASQLIEFGSVINALVEVETQKEY